MFLCNFIHDFMVRLQNIWFDDYAGFYSLRVILIAPDVVIVVKNEWMLILFLIWQKAHKIRPILVPKAHRVSCLIECMVVYLPSPTPTPKRAFSQARGRYSLKFLVGVCFWCGLRLETLTLFQTKICDFPYPISDLTQKSIPYFRPVKLVHLSNTWLLLPRNGFCVNIWEGLQIPRSV